MHEETHCGVQLHQGISSPTGPQWKQVLERVTVDSNTVAEISRQKCWDAMPKKAIWARLPHLAPGDKRDIRTIFFYEQLLPDHFNRQKDNDLLANPLAASQGSTVPADSATSAASTQKRKNAQTSAEPQLLSLAPCLESTDAVLPAFPHVGGVEFAGLELSPVESLCPPLYISVTGASWCSQV